MYSLLIAWFAITSAETIDLTLGGDDLGRHLKNGELLLSSTAPAGTASALLHTNFYSYTQPDLEFVNHHWLTGVIFFSVWKLGGFAGLNSFYILLGALVLALYLRMAHRAAGLALAVALALALMPILRLRASVRPEIFTLLMSGIFFWLLWKHYEGSLSWRALLVLPALEVLWVNLHIGFIFGPIFIGAFLLGDLLERPPKSEVAEANPWESKFYREKIRRAGRWSAILGLTVAATLLNPSGLQGAFYPFAIWTNYGIAMIENQSMSALQSQGYKGEFTLIELTMLALYLSFIPASVRALRFPLALLALAVVLGEMTWMAIRNQPILAYFSLAAIAINAGRGGFAQLLAARRKWVVPTLALIMLGSVYYNGRQLWTRKQIVGLGLQPGRDAAAKFFADSRVQGPILNNLNVSGYLIHYLFPQYRVYVDSRPEAYTVNFLQDFYQLPMTRETLWGRLLDQYAFNAIFFSWASAWENDFLERRSADPAWAPVFFDRTAIILLKRTPANQNVIVRHEIPRERLLRMAKSLR